ncbi:protein JINGUBANG-like [Nymphaea colorata]|uniref:protein JINGUBANG-like n=1 Tax=Nymphaea colorata TaxID=210225 RepID=UPI00129D31CC|nr:protein JINGUBANG-like [Nymphaea colorata]
MVVLGCLTFPSATSGSPVPENLVFPTSSLTSGNCSGATTPPSNPDLLLLSPQSSLPSVPSLHNCSPDNPNVSAGTASYVTFSTKTPYGAVHALAASANCVFAGTTALLRFPNAGDLSESETLAVTSAGGAIKSIAPSGGRLFTAHQDGKIRVWEHAGPKRFRRVATLPTISDRAFRFLLPRNHVQVRRHHTSLWIKHVDVVSALAIRGGLLYSASWDRTLKVWRVSDFRCLESVRAHDDAINALAVSAEGTVYTGSADTRIKIWARPAGRKKHSLVATLEKHRSAVNALALSSDGSVLYSGACDRSILVWEKEGGAGVMAVTGALRGHKHAVLCLAYASELLISGSADQTIRIWRRGVDNQYSTVAVLEGHERPIKSLVVAPTEPTSESVLIYSGSLDGVIKVWRVWQPWNALTKN